MTRPLFTAEQVDRLLRPIRPGRVYTKDGHAHIAGWDVAAHLTRMFGFGGWEKEILSLDLVSESSEMVSKNGKDRIGWWVTYSCQMRLRVYVGGELAWQTDDAATGTASNLPSHGDAHDFAMKNAVTYALKRCAKDLGDQFGLSLYDRGNRNAVVGMTLVHDPATPEPVVTVTGEGSDTPEPDEAES